MKSMIFGLFCLVSGGVIPTTSIADEVIKTFPGGSANDLINSTKMPGADDKPIGAIKLQRKCRDSKGKLIDEGAPGYQECLKSRLDRPKRPPIPEAPVGAENASPKPATTPKKK